MFHRLLYGISKITMERIMQLLLPRRFWVVNIVLSVLLSSRLVKRFLFLRQNIQRFYDDPLLLSFNFFLNSDY